MTKDKYKITINSLNDPDASKFDYVNLVKAGLMLNDARFLDYDENEEIAEGEIFIMDMKNMGWRHLWKTMGHLMTAKFYSSFLQEAMPLKIVGNHIVNPSSIMDKMFTIFKPFIKQELLNVIHIHSKMEDLYEFIPRELLPVEWGGNDEISIKKIHNERMEMFKEKRLVF